MFNKSYAHQNKYQYGVFLAYFQRKKHANKTSSKNMKMSSHSQELKGGTVSPGACQALFAHCHGELVIRTEDEWSDDEGYNDGNDRTHSPNL